MMTEIAFVLFLCFVVIALVQGVFACLFVTALARWRGGDIADQDLPKVTVLLPLRGADPQLAESLRRLAQQNYPNYEIQVVVDQPNDPATAVVNQVMEEGTSDRIQLNWIQQRRKGCGLQCSALVEGVQKSNCESEVFVVIDGDLFPHPDWLRTLVAPLRDPSVGATFGNRWFMPEKGDWGSLVRYLWNVAAVIPMYVFRIPWGGSFAIRKQVLFDSGLYDQWARSMVHDAPTKKAIHKMGLRLQFVPALMMVIRQRCGLSFCLDFIKRQLMWTRTYHPNWSMVLLHALVTSTMWVAGAAMALGAVACFQWRALVWAAGGVAAYWLAMIALTGMIEWGVRLVVRGRGEAVGWLSIKCLAMIPLAIPLTQFTHLVAVVLATFKRRVTWRGVTYQIDGPFDVRIIEDRPFQQAAGTAESNLSL